LSSKNIFDDRAKAGDPGRVRFESAPGRGLQLRGDAAGLETVARGPPLIGNRELCVPRIEKGFDILASHALEGF
jgi:cytochrome c5